MARAARKPAKSQVISIQEEIRKRRSGGHKSRVATLNDITKEHAHRMYEPWDDNDVSRIASMLEKDETTFDMALAIGRTFYATQTARSHIRFALNHDAIFRRILK